MSHRILQAHCQSPTSQPARQSFVKELAKPTQRKIELKKISSPSENKKYANAQTNTTNKKRKIKLKTDNVLQGGQTRSRVGLSIIHSFFNFNGIRNSYGPS